MVNKKIITKKIATINSSLQFIENHCPEKFDEFASDEVLQSALLFHMGKSIQALIDLILHIISDEGWGVILHKSGMADILVKKNVIKEKSKEKLIRIIGFRNRLVHEYDDLDMRLTFDILKNQTDDIRDIVRHILKYLNL